MDGCFKAEDIFFSNAFWIFILKYYQKQKFLSVRFSFSFSSYALLCFLSFVFRTWLFCPRSWREREIRLKMKEARGSQFSCENENFAKILHKAFIFRHTRFTEKKSVKQMKQVYMWILWTQRFYLTESPIHPTKILLLVYLNTHKHLLFPGWIRSDVQRASVKMLIALDLRTLTPEEPISYGGWKIWQYHVWLWMNGWGNDNQGPLLAK